MGFDKPAGQPWVTLWFAKELRVPRTMSAASRALSPFVQSTVVSARLYCCKMANGRARLLPPEGSYSTYIHHKRRGQCTAAVGAVSLRTAQSYRHNSRSVKI